MKQMQPGEVEPLECLDTDNIIGVRIYFLSRFNSFLAVLIF